MQLSMKMKNNNTNEHGRRWAGTGMDMSRLYTVLSRMIEPVRELEYVVRSLNTGIMKKRTVPEAWISSMTAAPSPQIECFSFLPKIEDSTWFKKR